MEQPKREAKMELPKQETKAKRFSLSIKQKVKILDEVQNGALGKAEIARKYGLSSSTLSTILKNKHKILDANLNGCAPDRKRSRDAKFPNLEKALIQWIKSCRARNVTVDGNILRSMAEYFSQQMNIEDFHASDGWIQRFKMRHGLSFKNMCVESSSVNPEVVRNWEVEKLQDLLKLYSPEDVYNADETALFFQMMPNKSSVFTQTDSAKFRVTLLVAANMAGTDKLPLLVIGKSKNPNCFKGLNPLPNNYKVNIKAWMTAALFEEWVHTLDEKVKRQGRKILLFVDNCTAHPHIKGLEAVRLEFLPLNATSVFQPMDQGIVQCLKMNYKRMLLNRVIACLDNDREYEIDILGAIHLSNEAWNQVSQQTIVNCFKHAGFEKVRPSNQPWEESPCFEAWEITAEDEDMLRDLQKHMDIPEGLSFSQFVNADASVQCTEGLSEEEIVAGAFKFMKEEISSSDDEAMDTPVVEIPSFNDALQAVETLKQYFRNSEKSEPLFPMMYNVENLVFSSLPSRNKPG